MLTSRIEMACACGLPLASEVLRSSASNHFRSAAFQAKLMGWGSQAESGFVHAKWQEGIALVFSAAFLACLCVDCLQATTCVDSSLRCMRNPS